MLRFKFGSVWYKMKKIKSYLGFATVGSVQDEYSLQNIQR